MLTSAVECGIDTFLFPEAAAQLASEWQGLANFQAFHAHGDIIKDQDVQVGASVSSRKHVWLLNNHASNFLFNSSSVELTNPLPYMQIGSRQHVTSAEDMQKAAAYCEQPGFFVLDCSDWQIIPAENMVATFQVSEVILCPPSAFNCCKKHT